MTICFTLPYSSGGCEERRIKFDLLTAIIKCSLLAPIKARRLMLTWLTLMQPLHFLFLHQLHFVKLEQHACVSTRFHTHQAGCGNVHLLMAHYLICILADGKRANRLISFSGCFVETQHVATSKSTRSCGIYYFGLSCFISKFICPQYYYYTKWLFLDVTVRSKCWNC